MLAEVTPTRLEALREEVARQVGAAPRKLAVVTMEIPRLIQAVQEAPLPVLESEALGSALRPLARGPEPESTTTPSPKPA